MSYVLTVRLEKEAQADVESLVTAIRRTVGDEADISIQEHVPYVPEGPDSVVSQPVDTPAVAEEVVPNG